MTDLESEVDKIATRNSEADPEAQTTKDINFLLGINRRMAQAWVNRAADFQHYLEHSGAKNRHIGWEEGFTARHHEDMLQQIDPSHPITRNNPYPDPDAEDSPED